MSDYYWNEYKNVLLDEAYLIDTLKYQQRVVNKQVEENNLDELSDVLGLYNVKYSDIRLAAYPFDELPVFVKTLASDLQKNYASFIYKVSMPILAITKKIGNVNPGCYSFDFKNNFLILYETDVTKIREIVNDKLVLAFFLNIEDAICLYRKKAYTNGIKEIGYVSKSSQLAISKEKNIIINEMLVPEQQLTNGLGINLRKCLLMETLILEVLTDAIYE